MSCKGDVGRIGGQDGSEVKTYLLNTYTCGALGHRMPRIQVIAGHTIDFNTINPQIFRSHVRFVPRVSNYELSLLRW